MDNRFKFRAMTQSVDIYGKHLEPQVIYGEGFTADKSGCVQIWKQEDDGTNNYIVEPNTLMLCSSLQDKHGVEIYEGDICEDKAGHRYIIGFTPLEGFYRAPIDERHHHCTLKNHLDLDLVVVGNVYEFNDTIGGGTADM